eukprot:CAMPEP_0194203264 /NCGR_PEP_ID=MMETSP0156-20130528/3090_1 /TAXON_ID=33649 /ORGANISM="Thalassionema nitzschioides, Strain L26-B" /LENGTH=40 /DNA_ID= /DNA_START= /DNA_END= /DNA_ORIENTATION=
MKLLAVIALAVSASAFAPASLPVRSATSLFNNPDGYGKYA